MLVLINSKYFRPLLSMRCSLSCVSNFLSCLYCCCIKLCSNEKHLLKISEHAVQDYVTSPANKKYLPLPSMVPRAAGTFCIWNKSLDRDALEEVNKNFFIESED